MPSLRPSGGGTGCLWIESLSEGGMSTAGLAAPSAAKPTAVGAADAVRAAVDELLGAIVKNPQLRTARRMSHVFRFEVPLYPKPLLITDAAINICPDLAEKADIVQNAIDFARILGTDCPKVALLAAVETVNPKMPATLDAAALCKMADRGQITGGLLDGPLAFDNAISPEAVRIKGIASAVAGDADIVACVGADTNHVDSFRQTLGGFSHFSRDAIYPYGSGGPNASVNRAGSIAAPLRPAAISTRPQFGSSPAMAVLRIGELAHASAMVRAASQDFAPSTSNVTNFDSPSPSLAT